MTNKKIAIPLVLALFIGVLAWWQVSGSQALGQMELVPISGEVDVIRDGKTLHVDGTVSLQPFDVIRTGENSEAELRLSGDRNINLAALSQARVIDGRTIENEKGMLKADTTDRLQVQFGDVTATAGDAHFRVDRGFSSARAASYRGSLRLDAVGQTRLTVPRLFEARVSAGDLPASPRPYSFDRKDLWDGPVLEDVILLDDALANWARGMKALVGPSRPGVPYFSGLADRPAGFVRPYLRRPTTDLLIGFNVADLAQKPLEPAFQETMQYRQDGGSWGVVATIMDAKPKPLTTALEQVTAGTGVVADGSGAEAEFNLASGEASGPSGGDQPIDGSGNDDDNNNDDNNNNDDDNNNNDDEEEEQPPPECTTEIECAGQEITDQLPGGGDDPDAEPSPAPSDGDPDGGIFDDL
jgi:hypothetical protein